MGDELGSSEIKFNKINLDDLLAGLLTDKGRFKFLKELRYRVKEVEEADLEIGLKPYQKLIQQAQQPKYEELLVEFAKKIGEYEFCARLKEEKKDLDAALEFYQQALAKDPVAARVLLAMGDLEKSRGNTEAAIAHYKNANEWSALGGYYSELGMHSEASAAYVEGKDYLGAIKEEKTAGNQDRAKEIYDAAREECLAQRNVRFCYLAALVEEMEFYDEASEFYEKIPWYDKAAELAEKAGNSARAEQLRRTGIPYEEGTGSFYEAKSLAEELGMTELAGTYNTIQDFLSALSEACVYD